MAHSRCLIGSVMSGRIMRIYKYEVVDDARYERVKNRPTVKRAECLLEMVREDLRIIPDDRKAELMDVHAFAYRTFYEVIRDADERKGSGSMTKSSDQVRRAVKMYNRARAKYDKKYL